jgi:O-antigen/teichoic acid export membrane protein
MLTLITFILNSLVNFGIGLGIAYFLGAQEFGVYALASAAGVVLQTLLFEWLRLSTNRFFGEAQNEADPGILATLNRGTGLIAIALSGIALVLYLVGGLGGTSAIIAAMAPLVAIAGGLFDYRSALARARFQHKRYAMLVIVKNAAASVLMLGAAYVFARADVVLAGLCLSALAGVAVSSRFYLGEGTEGHGHRPDLLGQFARYAAPLIIANLMFLAMMLLMRSGVAMYYGLAESGRYSLALDIGLKLVATIGSGLDLVLFQLAVKAEAEHGAEAARAQLSRSIGLVVAALLPTSVGLWLALPSFEALFVSPSYRGTFETGVTALLPGLFAYALIQYAINPLFQIARRTLPVIASAAVSLAAGLAALALLPVQGSLAGALATSVGFVAGLVVIIAIAAKVAPVAVPWGMLARSGAATAAMVLAVLPLRALEPGMMTLGLTACAGATVYGLLGVMLNIGDCRALLMRRLRPAAA